MNGKEISISRGNRIHFLDNLRTIIIFLVVLYHAGIVYESSGFGAWVWIVHDPATNDLVGILSFLVIDIFVMATIFFISGYLTPMSLKNKNGWAFLKSRFRRLIIPWIIAVLTLIPLYKVIFLYSRGLPQERWTTYFHFSNGNISSQNWLWFLPVLFLFNLLYVLLSSANWVPPRIPLKSAIVAIFFIGFVNSFGMDMLGIRGSWTHTPLIDFQNERLLLYFMIFLLGSLCFRQNVFASKPKGKTLYMVVNAIAWIPITSYIFFGLIPFFTSDGILISPVVDKLVLWLSFYLSLLSLLYLLIQTFWRYLDKPGRIWSELNQNSYYVYIIHLIVLGGIALLLLNSALPSLLKYLTLTVSTYLASNLIISLYRQAATSRKAINQPKILSSSR
jgi:fucose 4-O-acetylase-like acetyltransferase